MTDLFQATVTLARQQALPGIKARAERLGVVSVVCAGCYRFLEDVPSAGVAGISSGMCDVCGEQKAAGEAR